MNLEPWQELKLRLKKEKDEAKHSVNEMAHVKKGILCLVEKWMNELEADNGK